MALITALKINIVSIFALPFLLIATAVKMVERALAKIKTLGIMLLLTAVTVLIIFFANNRDILPTHIRTALTVIAVTGVALAVLGVLFKMVSVVLKIIVAGFRLIFDTIYKAAYSFYMTLAGTAGNDYEDLCYESSPVIAAILCIFYHLLKLINLFIVAFIRVSLFVFILASGAFAYVWYTKIAAAVQTTFGLSMREYLGSFSTWSLIGTVLLFVVVVADVAVVLISLGMEWTGWSKELSFDDAVGDKYLDMLEDDEESFREISVNEDDEDYEYYEIVSDHLLGASDLMDEIRDAKEIQSNPLLENMSNEYFKSLSEITGAIAESRGRMDHAEFTGLKPFIKHLDRQREDLYKIIDKQYELASEPQKEISFFSGCNTLDKLNKRYKSLCKAYHPDAEGGDEDTFIAIKEEYEQLKKDMEE